MVVKRNETKIRKKGPTVFVGITTAMLLLLAPFKPELIPYSLYSLSVLAVRLIKASLQI